MRCIAAYGQFQRKGGTARGRWAQPSSPRASPISWARSCSGSIGATWPAWTSVRQLESSGLVTPMSCASTLTGLTSSRACTSTLTGLSHRYITSCSRPSAWVSSRTSLRSSFLLSSGSARFITFLLYVVHMASASWSSSAILLMTLYLEGFLLDFGAKLILKVCYQDGMIFKVRCRTTSRLASTSTFPSTTSLSSLLSSMTLYTRRCIMHYTSPWKPFRRHWPLIVRVLDTAASVAGQLPNGSVYRRLSRGALPVLTSCSQHPAVRCAALALTLYCCGVRCIHFWFRLDRDLHIMTWSSRLGGSLLILACTKAPFTLRYDSGHLDIPEHFWFLHSLLELTRTIKMGSTGRCKGLSSKGISAKRTRRGARGRGIITHPSSAPNDPNGANLCSAWRSGPMASTSAHANVNSEDFSIPPTPPSPSISSTRARTTPPTSQTNGTTTNTLSVLWWNIEHVSSVWHDETFWEFVEQYDLVFLLETHHTILPMRKGWTVQGQERKISSSAGGVLALIRLSCPVTFAEPDYPFDGCLWLREDTDEETPLTLGAIYVPSASDPRFRCLQGRGRLDHFDSLREQLADRAQLPWILGGDMNAITGTSQPHWGSQDLLDHLATDIAVPTRESDDKRPRNAHGNRFLRALEDLGLILNGLVSHNFAGSFTRLPQRRADCPGVIDYVSSSPLALQRILHGSLRILESCADFSDHLPMALRLHVDAASSAPQGGDSHFRKGRLPILKMPSDPATWIEIEAEIATELETLGVAEKLQECLATESMTSSAAEARVDTALGQLTGTFHRVFERHKLVRKRNFDASCKLRNNSRHAAPECLQDASKLRFRTSL